MTTLTLWAPGGASPIDRSAPKKSLFQASLQELLPQDQVEVLSNSVHSVQNASEMSNLEVVEISSLQAWKEALQEIAQAGICGLDLETTGLDPLSDIPD